MAISVPPKPMNKPATVWFHHHPKSHPTTLPVMSMANRKDILFIADGLLSPLHVTCKAIAIFALAIMKTTIVRRARFNAAHRLYRPDWSDEKNREVFGLCSNPHYHGHDYTLEVYVTGTVDPQTGFVMDLKQLKDIISQQVLEPFDHRNLNLDTEEFRSLNPTCENIARVIYEKLRRALDPELEVRVRLSESENNAVVYPA